MKLSYIIAALEAYAPRALQEKWDNTGLQVGLPLGAECTGALVCVDVTPQTVRRAVELGCNLIVSHHPLIFKGIKSLAGRNLTEETVYEAVRAGVAVYSTHTALDSTRGGVSYAMASRLGAAPVRVLAPVEIMRSTVSVICPREACDDVRMVLFDNHAGEAPLGSNHTLSAAAPEVRPSAYTGTESEVEGWTFESDNDIIPAFELIHTPLTRVSAQIYGNADAAVAALRALPCADRIRVDVTTEKVVDPCIGLGLLARLEKPLPMSLFTAKVKEAFGVEVIRANVPASNPDTPVQTIALCGGAGGEFIDTAAAAGAQAYVTADVRYHDFADHREGMAIFDIGHYESEACTKDIIFDVLSKKFTNFAVHCEDWPANPVIYL